jgi:hypothetical protein
MSDYVSEILLEKLGKTQKLPKPTGSLTEIRSYHGENNVIVCSVCGAFNDSSRRLSLCSIREVYFRISVLG